MSSTATLMEDSTSSATLSALSESITSSLPSVQSESSRASELSGENSSDSASNMSYNAPSDTLSFGAISHAPLEAPNPQALAFDMKSQLARNSDGMQHLEPTGFRNYYVDDDFDDENLSPSRIDEILIRAEARLKEQRDLLRKMSPVSGSGPTSLDAGKLPEPYMRSTSTIVRPRPKILVSQEQRSLAETPRKVEAPLSLEAKTQLKASTGLQSHYNLPRTKLTPELKRDLQLLNMRAVLDPKRMYKKQGKFKIPEYSQVGTIVEGPTDFFNSRLNNRERKRTLVEETLALEASSGRFKRKYDEVQERKRSGKKTFYKTLVARRKTRRT